MSHLRLVEQEVTPGDVPEVQTSRDHIADLLLRGGYRLEVVARMYGRDSQQYADTLETWAGIVRNENSVHVEF